MVAKTDKHVLVTLRSAYALRDDGARFAYWKSGMFGAMLLGINFLACSVGLRWMRPDAVVLPMVLLALAAALFVAVGWCAKRLRYPHCVRLTREELDAMRDDMGIPDDVFRLTQDSVIHGSKEDFQADEIVAAAVQKGQAASRFDKRGRESI